MSEKFSRQQVDAITAPWLNLCKEQEEQITKLQAELHRHKIAIGRLYNRFRKKEPMPRLWVDEAFAFKEIASGD